MVGLVLSLFPGIGLLDMAFEEEGFCVVRGPDLLWGGDIRRFHPPAGKFDGVIGGPPCQIFSRMRHINPKAGQAHGNLIPEFERVVREAWPLWFLMENVPEAPKPAVSESYESRAEMVRDVWCGGDTSRMRRFTFGSRATATGFRIETRALHRTDPTPAALAGGARRVPVALGGSGKVKASRRVCAGDQKTEAGFSAARAAQGLPDDFDLPPFTVAAKVKALGNGVPLAMGRAVAKAVKTALCLNDDPLNGRSTIVKLESEGLTEDVFRARIISNNEKLGRASPSSGEGDAKAIRAPDESGVNPQSSRNPQAGT